VTAREEKERRAALRTPTDDEIEAFLLRRPEVLRENPALLARLAAPDRHDGDGKVVDLQRHMLDRLGGEVRRLRDTQGALLAASRTNLATQAQIHQAVIALLDAPGREHFLHAVTQDLPQILDLDAMALVIEGRAPGPKWIGGSDIRLLRRGEVEKLLGAGRDIVLRTETERSESLFGPATDLVRSDALVRLDLGSDHPPALLAFGARVPTRFHPGQGTELLRFLCRVIERLLRLWLAR
jgi:uncharacterized protein YigA (DUF484 family)